MTTHFSILAGKFHGQGSLADYSPWVRHDWAHTCTHTHTEDEVIKFKWDPEGGTWCDGLDSLLDDTPEKLPSSISFSFSLSKHRHWGKSEDLVRGTRQEASPQQRLNWLDLILQSCVCVCVCVKFFQSCLTLCNSVDYGLPGSSVPGILQARKLEWVAMPVSTQISSV